MIHWLAHVLRLNRAQTIAVWYRGKSITYERCVTCGETGRVR